MEDPSLVIHLYDTEATHKSFSIVKLIAALGILFMPLTSRGENTQVEVTVGHVMAKSATAMAAEIFREVDRQFPDIKIVFRPDLSSAHDASSARWRDFSQTADILVVYAGSVAIHDEISILKEKGHIQPLSALPKFRQLLNPSDVYENLWEPALIDGEVWAAPVRVCPLCIYVEWEGTSPEVTWNSLLDLAELGGFTPIFPSDYFSLWATLSLQAAHFSDNDVWYLERDQEGPMRYIERLAAANFSGRFAESGISEQDIKELKLGLADPDLLTDYPGLVVGKGFYPLPNADGPIMSTSRSWYVALSSKTIGPARDACLQVMSALLTEEVQLLISQYAYNPPVRPSIASGEAFQSLAPPGGPRRAFVSSVPRLVFPGRHGVSGDDLRRVSEFFSDLDNPDNLQSLDDIKDDFKWPSRKGES